MVGSFELVWLIKTVGSSQPVGPNWTVSRLIKPNETVGSSLPVWQN